MDCLTGSVKHPYQLRFSRGGDKCWGKRIVRRAARRSGARDTVESTVELTTDG